MTTNAHPLGCYELARDTKTMNIPVLDNGAIRNSSDVQFADKIIELKRNKDPWVVIDLLVNAWAERSPEEFKGFKFQAEAHREGLYDSKYGQTANSNGQERRFTMMFPQSLYMMIRAVFKGELKMDKKWMNEFAYRYPFFRIPNKL